MDYLTSLATNDEEFEKRNDGPRPPTSSLKIYKIVQDKIKHPNQSYNYN